ncbi:ATP-binding protein [Streptomyces sp. NPDC002851]
MGDQNDPVAEERDAGASGHQVLPENDVSDAAFVDTNVTNLLANAHHHGTAPIALTLDNGTVTIQDHGPGFPRRPAHRRAPSLPAPAPPNAVRTPAWARPSPPATPTSLSPVPRRAGRAILTLPLDPHQVRYRSDGHG